MSFINTGTAVAIAKSISELNCKIRTLTEAINNSSSPAYTGSEVELVPNNTTGFYDQIIYSWVNGAQQPTITTPSTYPIAQQITKDVEYIPNNITGFYDKIVHTYINGVLQPDVITPTIYPVTGLPPAQHDFEYVCDTNTGFIQEIEKITDGLGVITTTITPTLITCEKSCSSFGVLGQLTSWAQIIN